MCENGFQRNIFGNYFEFFRISFLQCILSIENHKSYDVHYMLSYVFFGAETKPPGNFGGLETKPPRNFGGSGAKLPRKFWGSGSEAP